MESNIKSMPIIEKRKLVKSGASFVVSLPRKWLEEHGPKYTCTQCKGEFLSKDMYYRCHVCGRGICKNCANEKGLI